MEIRMLLTDGFVSRFKCANKLRLNDTVINDFNKVVQELYKSSKLVSEDSDNMSLWYNKDKR